MRGDLGGFVNVSSGWGARLAANTAHPQGFALRAKSAFEGPVVVGFAS